MSPLPKNLSLKNCTALELNRIIGDRMKQYANVTKSHSIQASRTGAESLEDESNQQLSALKQKLFG